MAVLESGNFEVLRLVTDRLTPCSVAALMCTTPTLRTRLLNGGVVNLHFDKLDAARVLSVIGANGTCPGGNCSCLLKSLHRFTQLRHLTINDERFTECLGRGAAPYHQGLPPSLVSLTLVLHKSFLRWLHASFRQDYSLSSATPELRYLHIGELSSLEDRAKSRLKIDSAALAAPAFVRLLATLPASLELLELPPASHELTPNLLPNSLTKTSMMLRWKSRLDSLELPSSLVSLNLQINDAQAFERNVTRMFPPTLTDLTVFMKLSIKDDVLYDIFFSPFLSFFFPGLFDPLFFDFVPSLPHSCIDLTLNFLFPLVTTFGLAFHRNNANNQMAVDFVAPQWVKHLPRSINSLHLHNVDNVRLSDLPALLTHLRLTSWWPAKGGFDHKDWRSEYLTHLKIKRWDPVSTEFLTSLPRTVTHLVLKTDKATTISRLPESLTHVTLPAQASFHSLKWPSGLTSLKVHRLTNFPADSMIELPKSLTSLAFSCPALPSSSVTEYFKEIPRSVKHLTLWNRKLDISLFAGLKDSLLESLEIYTGESKEELLAVEMSNFRWNLLENLPTTLTRLRLPVSSQKLEFSPTLKIAQFSELAVPHVTIEFETLQLLLVHCPNIRRVLAKQFKFETDEHEPARQMLLSHPLVTLQTIKISNIGNGKRSKPS